MRWQLHSQLFPLFSQLWVCCQSIGHCRGELSWNLLAVVSGDSSFITSADCCRPTSRARIIVGALVTSHTGWGLYPHGAPQDALVTQSGWLIIY